MLKIMFAGTETSKRRIENSCIELTRGREGTSASGASDSLSSEHCVIQLVTLKMRTIYLMR